MQFPVPVPVVVMYVRKQVSTCRTMISIRIGQRNSAQRETTAAWKNWHFDFKVNLLPTPIESMTPRHGLDRCKNAQKSHPQP